MKKANIFLATLLAATIVVSQSTMADSLTWTNQSGSFTDQTKWDPAQSPAGGDSTTFTNDTTYSVTLGSTLIMATNFFNGKGTVTFDATGNTWTITNLFSIGRGGNATATVFWAGGTLAVTNNTQPLRVGDAGASKGVFNVTNGIVIAAGGILGVNSTSSGTLTISGSGVWTNAVGGTGTLTIGSASAGNYLYVTNGGKLFTTAGTIGSGGSGMNTAIVADVGSSWTATGTITIGDGGANFNTLIVSNGATLTISQANQGLTVGRGTVSNSMYVVGIGANQAFVTNAGTVQIGFGGSANYNKLSLSNAAFFAGALSVGRDGDSNTLEVLNLGTLNLRNGLLVVGNSTAGSEGSYGSKILVNGGLITNQGNVFLGNGNALNGANSLITVTNGGKVVVNAGAVVDIGRNSSGNTIEVADNGFWDNGTVGIDIGTLNVQSGNSLSVHGSGALMTNVGTIIVGRSGSYSNSVIVSGGGTLKSGQISFGDAGATNNFGTVQSSGVIDLLGNRLNADGVAGALTINGGIFTNAGDIIWGNSGSSRSNVLTVSGGGQLFTGLGGAFWDIGRNGGAASNLVLITDNTSKWDAGGKTVAIGGTVGGAATTASTLRVTANGMFTNGAVTSGSQGVGHSFIVDNSGVALLSALTVNSASSAFITNNGQLFMSGNISGSGTIAFGSGALLGANADWSSSSALILTDGVTTVRAAGQDNAAHNITLSGVLSGPGGLTKTGGGSLTLSTANTYIGATIVSNGFLVAGANFVMTTNAGLTVVSGATFTNNFQQAVGSIAGGGNIILDAAGMLSNGFDNTSTTFGGVISGPGAIAKYGTGELALTGTNTYAGGTTINGGTFTIGGSGQLGGGSYAGLITNNAILVHSSTSNQTLSGVISGTGVVIKNSSSTLTLSGANTYTGDTTNNAGWVSLGANNPFGNAGVLVMNGGTLASAGTFFFTNAVSLLQAGTIDTTGGGITVSGVVSGASGLYKVGAGILTLASNNLNTAGVTIQNGTVAITKSNSFGSGLVTLGDSLGANNATLSASGMTVTNAITVAAGNTGTMRIVGSAQTFSGDITLNHDLIAFDDSTGNQSLVLNGVIAGTGNLIVTNGGGSGINRLGGNNANWKGNLIIAGGNFRPNAGNSLNASNILIIGNANGANYNYGANVTHTIAGIADLAGITGAAGGVTGGDTESRGMTLAGSGQYSYSGAWSGNLTLNDQAGTLVQVFVGANTYSYATTITKGTLVVNGSGASSNSAFTVNWNGGLRFTNDTAFSIGSLAGTGNFGLTNTGGAAITLTSGGNNANTTYSGVMSGSGSYVKIGTGTNTLSGANTYSGATTVSNGALAAGVNFAIATNSALVVVNGATFTNNFQQAVGSIAGDGNFILGAAGVLSNGFNNTSTTVGGVISGAGALAKYGTGTLILTGANTYSSFTLINAGTLQVGAGGTTGQLGAGNITNNANLVFNRSDAITVGNTNVGSGALFQISTSTVTLNGSNSYSGGTFIKAGTVGLGHVNAAGAGAVTVGDATVGVAATLSALTGGTFTNAIVVAGGAGARTLGVANSLQNATLTGSVTLNTNVTLFRASGSRDVWFQGVFSGTSDIVASNADTSFVLGLGGNNANWKGNLIIASGGFLPGAANSLSASNALIIGNANNANFNFGGPFGVTVAGISDLAGITGAAGGITGGFGTRGITVAGAGNYSYTGTYSDGGGGGGTYLTVALGGSGSQTLTGTNTYTGPTAINTGTLRVTGLIAGAGDVSVASGGTLTGSGVVSGKVTNAGIVLADSTTPLRLYGSSLYNSGIVTAHNGGLVVSGVFTNAGTVAMMNSVGTFNSAVVNSGAWNMDPSTNVFNNTYTVTSSGYISMTTGDVYIFTNNGSTVGSFINNSTQSNSFNTLPGKFVFDSTLSLTQQFATAGNNIGNLDTDGGFNTVLVDTLNTSLLTQFSNNFALGTLQLSGISTTEVFDANLVGGRAHGGLQAALFLNTLSLDPGTFLIISNNVQVYFINSNAFSLAQVQLIGNGGLHQLVTEISTIPEPNVILLWLSSVLTVYLSRRRKRA